MNLIDHYNKIRFKCELKQSQQGFSHYTYNQTKGHDKNLPKYLQSMKYQFQKLYQNSSISIFSDPEAESKDQLVISLLHRQLRHGRYNFYNEIIINEQYQTIIVKGLILLNNQFIKLSSYKQITMALRKANNLNQEISPLKLYVHPIQGTIELINCSYVDSKLKTLNTSLKNIQYFTQRINFVLNLVIEHFDLILFLTEVEPQHHLTFPSKKCKKSIDEGGKLLKRLEDSLYRTSFENGNVSKLNYDDKKTQIFKSHQFLDKSIENILKIYHSDVDEVQYRRPIQIDELASYNYQDPQIISQYANIFDSSNQYKIFTRIRFSSKKIDWESLAEGGYGKVDKGNAWFSILDDEGDIITRKMKGDNEEETTSYTYKQFKTLKLAQEIITRKIQLQDKKRGKRMDQQKNILKKFRGKKHPNIMTYLQSDSPEDIPFLYSLFEENQSLQNLIRKSQHLSFFQKLFMVQQAAKGLLFLHSNNIIHLDFKPANLIVGKRLIVKVCDFGQSCNVDQQHSRHKFGKTFPFASPQAYSPNSFINEKYDVYSIGVTIYKCLFSQHIWGLIPSKASFLRDLKTIGVTPILIPEQYQNMGCSKILRIIVFLCLRCVSEFPKMRPSLTWVVTILEQCRKYLQLMYSK